MNHKCSLCGNPSKVESENCFGFRYLCRDCNTFIWIRYNPGIYTLQEATEKVNNVLINMKHEFSTK